MAFDPICGMTVDPAHAAGKQKHKDETYYFCSRRCMVKFIADPEGVLKNPPKHHVPAHADETAPRQDAHVRVAPQPSHHAPESSQTPAANAGGAYVCLM